MTSFPFNDPVSRRTLDHHGVEEILRVFEDAWAEREGKRLTSAQFYDRYRQGLGDSMFGMAWASYYEAFRRINRDRASAEIVSALVASA